jgi:hypothetical protein
MLFEHITIITIITGIADITVIGTGTIERNFMVKRGRCGISFAAALHDDLSDANEEPPLITRHPNCSPATRRGGSRRISPVEEF